MKAIETRYRGHRFRSRTEARWAVLFDALNVRYEYEAEGYELDGATRYLPDFFLPAEDVFIEVKGDEPTRTEIHKAGLLAFASGLPVIFAIGQPGYDRALMITPNLRPAQAWLDWIAACPDWSLQYRVIEYLQKEEYAVPHPDHDTSIDKPTPHEHRYTDRGYSFPFQQLDYDPSRRRLAIWWGFSEDVVTSFHTDEFGIEHLTRAGEAQFDRRTLGVDHDHEYVIRPERSKPMLEAINAAKSARFEHGENGAS